MSNNKYKVLLLGGADALGAYLIPELLSRGHEVSVTSGTEHESNEKKLHYLKGNAKEDEFLEIILAKKYDVIIDFMVHQTDDFGHHCKKILNNVKHYVFLSTYRVYGDSGAKLLTEESSRLLDTVKDKDFLTTNDYGLAKARQEDILKNSGLSNWSILRPSITYSRDRFQLGTMKANEFLYRSLNNKPIIFPREILQKETTMSWAGDVAKLIAPMIMNKEAFGEIYNVSTSEHQTWKEILDYYKEFLDIKVKTVSLETYTKTIGRPYRIKYDCIFNRIIDNTKILELTSLKQEDFISIHDGLRMELTAFSKAPKFKTINKSQEKKIDSITNSSLQKLRKKLRPRTRLRQIKSYRRSRSQYDGAIVTLAGYYNYGSIIQRYAMQCFLKEKGLKYRLLDFEFMHSRGYKAGSRKNLETFAHTYYDQEKFDPRYSRYYKTYIVGSDQVWRDFFKDWGQFGRFFLNFVKDPKAKRIAYAASFGRDTLEGAGIDAEKMKKIIPLIEKFDAISVREQSGVRLVEELGGVAAKHVLDPTMLLSAASYSELIDSSKFCDQETQPIFCYILDASPSKRSIIKQLEKTNKMKAGGVFPHNGQPMPSVEEWLKGFRDSKLVVTDSFHGLAFSIINSKDFIVFGNLKRGLARITELLALLGIEDRIILEEDIEQLHLEFKPIDWNSVNKKLDFLRQESSEWLLNNLRNP